MIATKADIIRQLQRDILSLQGMRPPAAGTAIDVGLGPVTASFPNASFPVGAIHEFLSADAANQAASSSLIAGLIGALTQGNKVSVWVSAQRTVFPPALKTFGIDPEKVIFVDLPNEKQALWVVEEVLACEGLGAVVGELRDISFIESRRLQLAVERSRVTGFILRHQPRQPGTTACVSRWQVEALSSDPGDQFPGLGVPRWKVSLLKIRNGKTGTWEMEWRAGRFHTAGDPALSLSHEQQQRKAG